MRLRSPQGGWAILSSTRPVPYGFVWNVQPDMAYTTVDSSGGVHATQGTLEILWDFGPDVSLADILAGSSVTLPLEENWSDDLLLIHALPVDGSSSEPNWPETILGSTTYRNGTFYVRELFNYYLTNRSSSITEPHSFPTQVSSVVDLDGDGTITVDETTATGLVYAPDELKWVMVSRHRNVLGHRRYLIVHRPQLWQQIYGINYAAVSKYYADSGPKDSIYDSDFVLVGNSSAA